MEGRGYKINMCTCGGSLVEFLDSYDENLLVDNEGMSGDVCLSLWCCLELNRTISLDNDLLAMGGNNGEHYGKTRKPIFRNKCTT
jgi:hypothetical protein